MQSDDRKMKGFIIILLASLLLADCANARIQPTATPILTSTETLTRVPPTRTPKPTLTPNPTVTFTPSLPNTIEFIFPVNLSEQQQNKIKVRVDQAYWFFASLGCSPEGFEAKFYNGEGGYANYYADGLKLEVGLADLADDFIGFGGEVSHEIAHTMCQIAYVKAKSDHLGSIDLRWLTEGVANYFSAMEQIHTNGGYGGIKATSLQDDHGLLKLVSEQLCDISLKSLEPGNAQDLYPEAFWAVGDVATRLLVRITPDGVKAVLDYYNLLPTTKRETAFEQAFGKTKEDF